MPAKARTTKTTAATPEKKAQPRTRKAATKTPAAQPKQPAKAAEVQEKAPAAPRLRQADLVLRYLYENPGGEFTPGQIGKAIAPEGHKPLGVRDACARLAKAGEIRQVSAKPLRYTAAVSMWLLASGLLGKKARRR